MGAAAQLSVLLGLLPSRWSVCFPRFAQLKATGSWIPLGDRPPLLHACLPWSHSFHPGHSVFPAHAALRPLPRGLRVRADWALEVRFQWGVSPFLDLISFTAS